MKRLLLFLFLLGMVNTMMAQYVYTINADSVKITNHCDTAELIIENHTQHVPGFLFNKGRGRTEFRRVLQKLDPTTYLIGGDTLYTPTTAWIQGGNSFGLTGVLGTLDNNHLDFYTNHNRGLRLTNTGNLLLGTVADNGAKLQVNGNGTFSSIYTSPGPDTGYGVGHIYLNTGAQDIIGTYGYDMVFKMPSTAQTFRFQFGSSPHLFESATDFNIIGNNGGNVTLASANKFLDIVNVQNIYTDATAINLTASNYANGDGVVIQRGTRSNLRTDPMLSLRDSITDVFKVLRNGAQYITGNITSLNPVHTVYNPTITQIDTAPIFSSLTGMKIAPILNISGNYQQAYAMDISPTYNLNGHPQHEDAISAALHIGASLGGIRIDQGATYSGVTGQPIYIYQGGGADKEQMLNYRNGCSTTRAFIWNLDNRPATIHNAIIPALRSTLPSDGTVAGAGVSFSLDRYYYAPEASIDMKYELTPARDTASTLKTAIAFNTIDLGYRSAPLYISGAKIGMGTTMPAAQLHTTGSVRFAGLTADSSQTRVLVSDANGNLSYRNLPSWATNGIFNADIAVKGKLSAQQVRLMPAGWADYVFDKTYRLPSLAEVEGYIKQYNRLPGIPAAAEVKQNGIEVGESQAVLLKKIEELTLYAIEQNKKIEAQNKDLQDMKQEINELKKYIAK